MAWRHKINFIEVVRLSIFLLNKIWLLSFNKQNKTNRNIKLVPHSSVTSHSKRKNHQRSKYTNVLKIFRNKTFQLRIHQKTKLHKRVFLKLVFEIYLWKKCINLNMGILRDSYITCNMFEVFNFIDLRHSCNSSSRSTCTLWKK